MRNFSSGLLYSVTPEYLPQLHIDENEQIDSTETSSFSWQQDDISMTAYVALFLKLAAKALGLSNPDH